MFEHIKDFHLIHNFPKNYPKYKKLLSNFIFFFTQFIIHVRKNQLTKRDLIKQFLLQKGILTEIHYPIPPNKQKAMKGILDKEATPISEKIHSSDDLYRKHIIRKLAGAVGVPEISCRKRKKALQYGSKIHKSLLKTR